MAGSTRRGATVAQRRARRRRWSGRESVGMIFLSRTLDLPLKAWKLLRQTSKCLCPPTHFPVAIRSSAGVEACNEIKLNVIIDCMAERLYEAST